MRALLGGLTCAAGGAALLMGFLLWRYGSPRTWPLRTEVYPEDRIQGMRADRVILDEVHQFEAEQLDAGWDATYTALWSEMGATLRDSITRHFENRRVDEITEEWAEQVNPGQGLEPDHDDLVPLGQAPLPPTVDPSAEPEWMTAPKPRGRKRCACQDTVSSGQWHDPKHVEHRRLARLAIDAADAADTPGSTP